MWDKLVSFNGYSWRHQFELILFGEKPQAPSVPTGDGDILKCRAEKVDGREHPAEKPTELIARLIEKSVPDGGTVLDPFMGSGTTGVACMQLGRKFIGCEIDPKYFAITEKRIKQVAMQMILPLGSSVEEAS